MSEDLSEYGTEDGRADALAGREPECDLTRTDGDDYELAYREAYLLAREQGKPTSEAEERQS